MKEQMNQMSKLKTFLRCHRRTRRHATLQNLFCATVLFGLGLILVRSYAAAHTMEAVVDRWCEKNFFGEAEIYSVMTYEFQDSVRKGLVIGKDTAEGKHCEAVLTLKQENPLKWRVTGSQYTGNPLVYDFTSEDESENGRYGVALASIRELFPEFQNAWDVRLKKEINENHEEIIQIQIGFLLNPHDSSPTYTVDFQVNLNTGEAEINRLSKINWKAFDKVDCQISEERMVFMAEKLAGEK